MHEATITDTASGEQYATLAFRGSLRLQHCELEPAVTIEVDDPSELVELLVTVAGAVEQATRRAQTQHPVTRGLILPENMGTRLADAKRLLDVAAGYVART